MKIGMEKSILKGIIFLFYITPALYLIADIIQNQSLYAIKDVIMLFVVLLFFSNCLMHSVVIQKRNIKEIITLFMYIIVSSITRMDDVEFWFISIREIFITPVMLIIIGSFLRKNQEDFLQLIKGSLYSTCIITILYSFAFKSDSYGLTNRLTSFWDSEHEPGIVGGLLILVFFISNYKNGEMHDIKNMIFPILCGGYCIVESGSRSVFLALFIAILFCIVERINLKRIIFSGIVIVGFIITSMNYNVITEREIDHNSIARIEQYKMAFLQISSHPFFGIGIDQYGRLGNRIKAYKYDGFETTTMDSTLLKYTMNLGMVFFVLYMRLFFRSYMECKRNMRNLFSIIIFGLVIGSVTGKLGAYPLNQYIYSLVGFMLVYFQK